MKWLVFSIFIYKDVCVIYKDSRKTWTLYFNSIYVVINLNSFPV